MNRSKLLFAVAVAAGALTLGACTPATPSGTWAAAGCYGSTTADAPDFRFSGTAGAVGNLTVSLDLADFSLSTDGTCSGVPLVAPYTFTAVRAASESAAASSCALLGLDPSAGQLQLEYPGFPADAWVCNNLPVN